MLDVDLPRDENTNPEVTLQPLKPWTQYAIFVKAITLQVHDKHISGAKSDIIYIRTHPSSKSRQRWCYFSASSNAALKIFHISRPSSVTEPTMAKDARAYANSSTKLIVKWLPPDLPNGNLTYYRVRWQQQAEDTDLYQHNYCSKGLRHLFFKKLTNTYHIRKSRSRNDQRLVILLWHRQHETTLQFLYRSNLNLKLFYFDRIRFFQLLSVLAISKTNWLHTRSRHECHLSRFTFTEHISQSVKSILARMQ